MEFEIREVLLCYSWLSTALKLYFLCSVDTSFTPLGRESTFSPSPLLTLLWSGICHKRYWISWSVSGTFSCCCWLFDLSQPLFLEISSWFRSHFVQAHLQVCSWLFFCFFFWWNEICNLIAVIWLQYLVLFLCKNITICLCDCSFNFLTCPSVISIWVNILQRVKNSVKKCCPCKALLAGWTVKHKKFGNVEMGWKALSFYYYYYYFP